MDTLQTIETIVVVTLGFMFFNWLTTPFDISKAPQGAAVVETNGDYWLHSGDEWHQFLSLGFSTGNIKELPPQRGELYLGGYGITQRKKAIEFCEGLQGAKVVPEGSMEPEINGSFEGTEEFAELEAAINSMGVWQFPKMVEDGKLDAVELWYLTTLGKQLYLNQEMPNDPAITRLFSEVDKYCSARAQNLVSKGVKEAAQYGQYAMFPARAAKALYQLDLVIQEQISQNKRFDAGRFVGTKEELGLALSTGVHNYLDSLPYNSSIFMISADLWAKTGQPLTITKPLFTLRIWPDHKETEAAYRKHNNGPLEVAMKPIL